MIEQDMFEPLGYHYEALHELRTWIDLDWVRAVHAGELDAHVDEAFVILDDPTNPELPDFQQRDGRGWLNILVEVTKARDTAPTERLVSESYDGQLSLAA